MLLIEICPVELPPLCTLLPWPNVPVDYPVCVLRLEALIGLI